MWSGQVISITPVFGGSRTATVKKVLRCIFFYMITSI